MPNLKKVLKKNKVICNLYFKFYRLWRGTLSVISPTLANKVFYFLEYKKMPNLKNPKNFHEKLIWLKLNTYNNNSIVTQCADKYKVREYIKNQGYSFILNELIGVWDSVEEIDWNSLPDKFALKCNHGCGYNIICINKENFDISHAEMQLKKWMKDEFWKKNAELQYKNIPKKIICESFLETDSGMSPDDYKIYCFNGEPKAILHISDRNSEKKGVFMSPKWEFISTVNNRHNRYEKPDKIPEKPKTLEQMLEIAKNLSKPFPFVRVDLYEVNNKVVFGELTFTPGSGIYTSETNIGGKTMGELLDISSEIENNK